MLPGGLPVIGHAISLVRDANALHMYARQWTRDLQPVSISLVGQRAYFILNPRDWATVWKAKTLSFDALVEGGLVAMFGVTAKGVQELQSDPDGLGPLLQHNHAYLKEFLGPGGSLEPLTRGYIKYLDIELQKEVSGSGIEVKLENWVRTVLTVASTNALLGPELLKQEPDTITRLWEWERDFQTLSLGLPAWMLKRAHANREITVQNFARHTFDKSAMDIVSRLQDLMRSRGVSERDIGAANFSFWSAVQANAPLTAFWMLHYILFIPGLLDKIRAEIAPAFDASSTKLTNFSHLLDHCPLFDSLYHEVLRYTGSGVGIRKVEEDTIIAGYTLLENALVMMPVRPFHFDPAIFGDDVNEFVPDRFIRDEKTLASGLKNPGTKVLRPFGGGTTLCPGRHFAGNEILSGVATILYRFDVQVVDGEKMTFPSSKEPTVGTYLPDRDVTVRIQTRK
ncbi:hypothetical protein M408DRAFT_16291 [Serendipita vermifera MAFF 305830]|uniref:Cytochrome P450 n=1 Tax=Serendipita vermifera MAFF 305830 TaxID=933852 RepID=A0A0C3BB34_SERVB|nr:hypothetical protein M408DRAFT_16291 [Serendipita vermifera MAFF 305830]